MHALLIKKTVAYFLLLLSFVLLHSIIHAHAQEKKNHNHQSMVLGLTPSRKILPTPNEAVKKPSETLDMTEALREVRDGYLISLNLGTPPQIIQVYMDTGSDLTWVPCGNLSFDCIDCGDGGGGKLIMSSFSPLRSSSSSRDSCSSSFCLDVHSSDNSYDPCTISGCSLSTILKGTCSRPCPSFAYTYGGGGVVSGSLTRDTLRVHLSTTTTTASSPGNGTAATPSKEIPGFSFGCVGTAFREPIGIAGFGRGSLSLPSQLGFLKKGFSHCFLPFKFANNPNFTSPLVVGALAISSKDYLQFTPMLQSPMFPNSYYIGLESVSINNITSDDLQVPSSLREFDSAGNGGTLIDSGTTYTHFPGKLYSWIISTLESLINYPRAGETEARTGFDLCYDVPLSSSSAADGSGDDGIPLITLRFLNNVSLVLPKGNVFYAMSRPGNSTVVKCLLFQSMDDEEATYGPAGVFGSFQQQNLEVVYDLEKARIGFRQTDCASGAASQGLHKI